MNISTPKATAIVTAITTVFAVIFMIGGASPIDAMLWGVYACLAVLGGLLILALIIAGIVGLFR